MTLPTDPSPTGVTFDAYYTDKKIITQFGVQQNKYFNLTLVFATTSSGLSQFISLNSLSEPVKAPADTVSTILTASPVACLVQFTYSEYSNDTNLQGGSYDLSYAVDETDPQNPRVLVTTTSLLYHQPGT